MVGGGAVSTEFEPSFSGSERNINCGPRVDRVDGRRRLTTWSGGVTAGNLLHFLRGNCDVVGHGWLKGFRWRNCDLGSV
jgi:hypothetical protein